MEAFEIGSWRGNGGSRRSHFRRNSIFFNYLSTRGGGPDTEA